MAMNYPYPTSPTSQGAYTTGIRSALKQKGISDEQITYDPNKGVMVNGTPFIRPEKNYGGSTYTSPSNFQNAWDAYSKSLNQPTYATGTAGLGTAAGAMVGATGMPTQTGPTAGFTQPTGPTGGQVNPLNEQINKIIQGLQNYGQNQPAFDPYSSAAYQAAQAQTARQTQQGIRQAQEAFGSAGFGRSTGLGERAQRIGQEGTQYLMTQVLPQIQAQEQARRQQEFQNAIASLQPLLGQQSREDKLAQQNISNAVQQAQLTGNYVPPGSQDIINQLVGLKNQAETSAAGGATPETMAQYQSQGDVLRNQLANMGIDISGLGAGTSATDVRIPQGVQTLQGKQTELNRTQTLATLTGYLPDGTPTNATQKQQLNDLWNVANQTGIVPNQLADLYGLPHGTQTQAAIKQAASISEANQRSETAASRESRIASTPGKSTTNESTTGGPKVSTAQFNDFYNTLQQKYGVVHYKTDSQGDVITDANGQPTITYTNTNNPDQKSKIVVEVLNLGLSDDQTLSLLNKMGITEQEARSMLGG